MRARGRVQQSPAAVRNRGKAANPLRQDPDSASESNGLRILLPEAKIQGRVSAMSRRINRDYRGRTLHIVTLLETSFVFLADLTRRLEVTVVCHFLKARVKDRSWHGVPLREIDYLTSTSLGGADVLLVSGVLRTGITEDFLMHSIQEQGPRTLRAATLLEKNVSRKVSLTPDYVGFEVKEQFLVGYGLGIGGKYANLPYIAEYQGAQPS